MLTSFTTLVQLVGIQIKTRLEYRADFVLEIASATIRHAITLAFIAVLFNAVPKIEGWGFYEIAFLWAILAMAGSIHTLFFAGVWQLAQLVEKGELDRLLLRPFDPQLHLQSLGTAIHGLAGLISGVVVAIWAGPHTGITWHWWSYPLIVMFVICGGVLHSSVILIASSMVFWTSSLGNALIEFVNLIWTFLRFPLSFFPPLIGFLFTWVVPFGFAGYIPVDFLLGHRSWWYVIGVPAMTGLFVFMSRMLFHAGLRRYESSAN